MPRGPARSSRVPDEPIERRVQICRELRRGGLSGTGQGANHGAAARRQSVQAMCQLGAQPTAHLMPHDTAADRLADDEPDVRGGEGHLGVQMHNKVPAAGAGT